MEKLLSSLTEYVEVLTLGALLLLIPAISFHVPLVKYVTDILKYAITENPSENNPADRKPISWIPGSVILFVILFSAGVLVNAAAYWFLQPAHIYIVDAVARHMNEKADPRPLLEPDVMFYRRVIPFLNRKPSQDESDNYYLDIQKQAQWQIQSPESFVTYTGSVLERSIRLVRGIITLIFLFVLWNLVLLLVLTLSLRWRPNVILSLLGWLKLDNDSVTKRVAYQSFCIVAGVFLYFVLMQSYWWLEALSHREVWAAAQFLNQHPAPQQTMRNNSFNSTPQ